MSEGRDYPGFRCFCSEVAYGNFLTQILFLATSLENKAFLLIGMILLSGCAHIKVNDTAASVSGLRISSHTISVSVYQIQRKKMIARPDIQTEIMEDIESALSDWGGSPMEDVGPKDDLTYDIVEPWWNDGPVGKTVTQPIAPPLGSGPRLVIWVSAKVVSRWLQTGEVVGDVLLTAGRGGGGWT
jgi:hypothetical protein